ncbi:hypothetical protein [Sphingobacterium mizutaii]|uniref:hypothetical protein n=1 Tax=Sphingobacterium mizutaii TaxID=1010 RepID=UPI001623D28D|nr:hypothetical protein [Sphingobacterium mizutaii]
MGWEDGPRSGYEPGLKGWEDRPRSGYEPGLKGWEDRPRSGHEPGLMGLEDKPRLLANCLSTINSSRLVAYRIRPQLICP